ncbi:MAG: ATP-binding protein [Cytophagales bacterium]|nr:ATP-binding protein [Cytophagales bacterium]
MASQLAREYQTLWVPEYARTYLYLRGGIYEERDLVCIAHGQIAWEKGRSNRLTPQDWLFCDTSMETLEIWSRYAYGRISPELAAVCSCSDYDIYFLSYIDVPWVYDPLREHPSSGDRKKIFHSHLSLLEEKKRGYIILKGDLRQRIQEAKNYLLNHS